MAFPLDVRFVREAEAKLGRVLPAGYVSSMCQDNGGVVKVGRDRFQLYPILDSSDRKRLARTCNDIIRETTSARSWPGFPADALAIGHNGAGDLLVLLPDPSGDRYSDTPSWWDHETGELHVIAKTIDQLLA